MYKSWTFTIRPREGYPSHLDSKVLDWVKKQKGAFLTYEKDGVERHLHGQIWCEPRDKGTVNKALERICANNIPGWDSAQNIILRRGTKIAYNNDFVENYLAKEDNILLNSPPPEFDSYYPSPEEQEKVKAASNAVDPQYHQYLCDFKEYQKHKNLNEIKNHIEGIKQVAQFLSYKIYEEKKYKVIKHKRDRVAITQNIYNYILGRQCYKQFITEEQADQLAKAQDLEM